MISKIIRSIILMVLWGASIYIGSQILTSIIVQDRSWWLVLLTFPFIWLASDCVASLYDVWNPPYATGSNRKEP